MTKNFTLVNSYERILTPHISSNGENIDLDFESQSYELPSQIQKQNIFVFLLNLRLQTIEDLIIVKPYGQFFGSLNKK